MNLVRLHSGFLAVPVVLLLLLLIGCGDTSVDPDTASVLGGDVDTVVTLNLSKGVVKVGFLGGSGGNTVIENFVRFDHRVRYQVDTLDDGFPIALKNVNLAATLDDENDPEDLDLSNPFHPLHRLSLVVPTIRIGPSGAGIEELLGDPEASTATAALGVGLRRGADTAALFIRSGRDRERGEVQVTSIDTKERLIRLAVNAELHHDAIDRLPGTVIISIILELPY